MLFGLTTFLKIISRILSKEQKSSLFLVIIFQRDTKTCSVGAHLYCEVEYFSLVHRISIRGIEFRNLRKLNVLRESSYNYIICSGCNNQRESNSYSGYCSDCNPNDDSDSSNAILDTTVDVHNCQPISSPTPTEPLIQSEPSTDMQFNHRGIHIANMNVRHLKPKMDEIKILLDSANCIDVFGLCETFLAETTENDAISFSGYNNERKERCETNSTTNNGGGILII